MSRRVVAVGMECITPLGNSVRESWQNLISSAQVFTPIDSLPNYHTEYEPYLKSLPLNLRVGKVKPPSAELLGDSKLLLSRQDERRMTTSIRDTVLTTYRALKDAQLLGFNSDNTLSAYTIRTDLIDPHRIGTCIGTGLPAVQELFDASVSFKENQKRPQPTFINKILPNMIAGSVSIKFGILGPSQTVSTACATGNSVIIDGFNMIKNGTADIAVVGATESPLHPLTIAGFHRLKSLSPTSISRPFDEERNGFVISEGTGVIILEELEHALRRAKGDHGPRILGEVVGIGMSSDAYHITSPNPNGDGAYRAMKMALRSASLSINDIDFVNAHATSTPIGDAAEFNAIERLLRESGSKQTRDLPLFVSSNKGAMGHLLGASGIVESIFTLRSLSENIVPHTLNLRDATKFNTSDVIELVKDTPLELEKATYAMSNSFGFGGVNTSIVFRKW